MQPTSVSAHVHIMNFRGVRAPGLAERDVKTMPRRFRDCALIKERGSQRPVCP